MQIALSRGLSVDSRSQFEVMGYAPVPRPEPTRDDRFLAGYLGG
jgi:hypothetical protein